MIQQFESFFLSPYTGALVAFLATAIGALPTLFIKNLSKKIQYFFIGLSAGVMLAATCFSLLSPSLELFLILEKKFFALSFFIIIVLASALLIHIANTKIPHEHFFKGKEGSTQLHLKQIWLFVLAITIHNIPEGLAIGTSLGSQDLSIAFPVLIGMALQDIPEGLVVSLGLLSAGYKQKDAFKVALITGLVEGVSALIGFSAIVLVQSILPWALGFAGGMMLYVIIHEMIPECHNSGEEAPATVGILTGFIFLMCLGRILIS